METEEKQKNPDDPDEFRASIVTLAKEGGYAALVLIVLSAIELLVENLKLSQGIKDFVVTIHEWSIGAVFLLLAIKSVIRVAARNWRQICKSVKQES